MSATRLLVVLILAGAVQVRPGGGASSADQEGSQAGGPPQREAVVQGLAGITEPVYLDRLDDPEAWAELPDWLANPSPTASVTRAPEGGLRFAVPQPEKGMKWIRSVTGAWLNEWPWLAVRYRARGLRAGAGYFVWLRAGTGADALALDQLKPDGAWHTIAADVSGLLPEDSVGQMAVQVQAEGEDAAGPQRPGAWVEIAWIAFMEDPPRDAEIASRRSLAGRDWLLAERVSGAWSPQAHWLPNPARRHRHDRRGDTYRFMVGDPGQGMKWAIYFDEPVEPSDYLFLSLRIRGRGTSIVGNYSIAAVGDALPDGLDFTALAPAALATTAGRWRQVDLPLAGAMHHPRVVGLAVQVQAWQGPAIVEIADIRFTRMHHPRRLSHLLSTRAGWPAAADSKAAAVPLGKAAQMTAQQARARFRLADWFSHERVLVENVPFRVSLDDAAVAATPWADESELTVPLRGRASEVYLMLLVRLIGREEHVRGGGSLMGIGDVDRLRVTLHYADGEARTALPARVPPAGFGVVDGVEVVCVRADPTRDLRRLTLYVGTAQATVGIAAITLNTTDQRRYDALWQVAPLPPVSESAAPLPEAAPSARLDGGHLVLANRHLEAAFDLAHGLALSRLVHRAVETECVGSSDPEALFGARVGEEEPGADDFALVATEPLPDTGSPGYRFTYRSTESALEATIALSLGDEPRIACQMSVRNLSGLPRTIEPIGPRLPSLAVGPAQDMWYLIPASATLLHHRPTIYAGWYSGNEMSLQFLDAFSPALGGGVCLMVRDLESLEKRYLLTKSAGGVAMGLDYQQRTLAPGESYSLAPTDILVHTGDWRSAFQAYRDWAYSWYRPAAHRPRWWGEVFNFRQQFLYRFDLLVDRDTRTYRVQEILEQDERDFGGVDFLHIFDWGYSGPYGRTYSRTGDHEASDYLPGGWEGFRAGVEPVRRRGVPVGYYIEGYLLDERGKLGQAHGAEWQMITEEGEPKRWPDSTEIYICPTIEDWQQVQAASYARMVERMDADGMYLDEFGFAGQHKWCWSPDHGHRVPSSSLQAEQALARRVRAAMSTVKPGVVLYTEDTPTDVNSQYQEGAFCYSMRRHLWLGALAPLKLFRFAFPDFKNIEILVCDLPTDTWATGVRWTFWNGEALWLEGKAADWFAPQTRRAIRECHRVLRAHRDAFAGDRAQPLVPTLAGGLYANMFRGQSETAYTVYNARNETYAGDVIALPHEPGMRYLDAFAEREIQPRLAEGRAVLSLTLDPQGVGCIVCRAAE